MTNWNYGQNVAERADEQQTNDKTDIYCLGEQIAMDNAADTDGGYLTATDGGTDDTDPTFYHRGYRCEITDAHHEWDMAHHVPQCDGTSVRVEYIDADKSLEVSVGDVEVEGLDGHANVLHWLSDNDFVNSTPPGLGLREQDI